MGLLDQVLGQVLGQGGQRQGSGGLGGLGDLLSGLAGGRQQSGGGNLLAALLPVALSMLTKSGGSGGGGLGGLLSQFQAAGLGQQADSWVSTGANMPLSAEQLINALGRGRVSEIASQAGLTEAQASGGLADLLPDLVNHLTPKGELPAQGEVDDALGGLRKSLGL
jgi:uncharacterized protein YidB (DUF937 family)